MELKLSPKFLSRNAFNIVLRVLVALGHHLAWPGLLVFTFANLLPLPSPQHSLCYQGSSCEADITKH